MSNNSILVVVDMQNDFIDGALGSPEAQEIVPRVRRLIEGFNGQKIYVTSDSHNPKYYANLEEGRMVPEHCIAGTHGEEIERSIGEALARRLYPNDLYDVCPEGVEQFNKYTFGSAFMVEELRRDVSELAIDTIIIVGLCTDICVISNALMIRAACPYQKIICFEDCCAGSNVDNHQAALDVMRSNCIEIWSYEKM